MENIKLILKGFIIGLGKKILIANVLGELCSIFIASNDKSILFSLNIVNMFYIIIFRQIPTKKIVFNLVKYYF